MGRTRLWCLGLAGLVLIHVAVVVGWAQASRGAGVRVGEPAPDFALTGLSGEILALSSYRGRPVVIHFFASWLGWSCWKGMLHLDDAADKYQERGLVVIGVAARDSAGAVGQMVEHLGLTFPIGLDPNSRLTVDHYRIAKIPTTVFVDRQGVVREIWVGPIDWPNLIGLVREIL